MTDELSFEEKVQGTLRFMRSKDERGLAEFIVFQSNAIDGLTKHNEELGAAYRAAITIDFFKSAIPDTAGNSSATPAQQTLCDASLNAEDGTAQS